MACRAHPGLALASVALLACAAAAPAPAQERLRLSETDEWTPAAQVEPGSPEWQLDQIRRAIADGHYDRAENLADTWLERHRGHALEAEAYLLRGDAFMARGDYYESLFDYEFIARTYPGSEAFVTALERELEIARLFASGTKRKLWGIRFVDASDEAQELLIRVQERLPGSTLAEEAGIALADFYFSRREMDLAATAYELFIENYPRSDQVSKARRRLIFAHLASFKGPEFDATGLYEARSLLRVFQATEPAAAQRAGADALLVRIDESDAQKLLATARWYMRRGNMVSAEYTIRRLVRRYPTSVATVEALRLMETILPRLSAHQRAGMPDYEAMRVGLSGTPPANPNPGAGAGAGVDRVTGGADGGGSP